MRSILAVYWLQMPFSGSIKENESTVHKKAFSQNYLRVIELVTSALLIPQILDLSQLLLQGADLLLLLFVRNGRVRARAIGGGPAIVRFLGTGDIAVRRARDSALVADRTTAAQGSLALRQRRRSHVGTAEMWRSVGACGLHSGLGRHIGEHLDRGGSGRG